MDRFESMMILVAISERGSLSKASRFLKIPLASVSRKISELEVHLGVKLLIRSTRTLEFTEYGRSYVILCKRIIDDVLEAERTVKGEYYSPKGTLVLTAPVLFGRLHLVPIVSEFLGTYPEVDVKMVLTDQNLDLIEEKIDLSLRIGTLQNSALVASKLGFIRQITCASPYFLKKFGRPSSPIELSNMDCISITSLYSPSQWTFRSGKSTMEIQIHSRFITNFADAGLEAAVNGVGVIRALSYQTIGFQKEKRLEIILEDFEPEPWPVHFVYTSGRAIPLKLRAFLEFAKPRIQSILNEPIER